MIYLAAPYSHPNENIKAERMRRFYEIDANLNKAGYFTVSPLHKVETCKQGGLADDWNFWSEYSYKLLAICDAMMVITLDGWEQSVGLQAEIEYCNKNKIPVQYIG